MKNPLGIEEWAEYKVVYANKNRMPYGEGSLYVTAKTEEGAIRAVERHLGYKPDSIKVGG